MKRPLSNRSTPGIYNRKFGPCEETAVPKWDPLLEEQLPQEGKVPLEWTGSRYSVCEDVSECCYVVTFQGAVVFGIDSFLVVPLARSFGLVLTGPRAIAVWAALSIIFGFYAALKRWEWELVVAAFLSPLVAPLLITVITLGERGWLIGFTGAALLVGLLVDMIATDCFHWITANPFVRAAEEKRGVWAGRFFGRLRLIDYPIGFLLFVVAVDLHLRSPQTAGQLGVILLVCGALAVIWSARDCAVGVSSALRASAHAFLLWFTWGRDDEELWGSKAPGMFRSRFGPLIVRRGFAFVVFFVVSGVFHRSIRTWAEGDHALWTVILSTLLTFVFPLVLTFTLLLAVAGRALAASEASLAERRDETLWQAIVERLHEE